MDAGVFPAAALGGPVDERSQADGPDVVSTKPVSFFVHNCGQTGCADLSAMPPFRKCGAICEPPTTR